MFNTKSFFNKIESLLLKLSLISIIILIGLQVFIVNNEISVFSKMANIEGNTIGDLGKIESGLVVLSIEEEQKFKETEVLVNGEVIDKFNGRKEVTIEVYNNDIVEINGGRYSEKVKVKVVGISKNIESPKLNTIVTTDRSIEILGKVVIK